jgi:hypothetical protein
MWTKYLSLNPTFVVKYQKRWIILFFKLSPCCSNEKESSGYFPGVWVLKADVSELCVGFIFIRWWRWNRHRVPKRRLLILRRRGNTQKTIFQSTKTFMGWNMARMHQNLLRESHTNYPLGAQRRRARVRWKTISDGRFSWFADYHTYTLTLFMHLSILGLTKDFIWAVSLIMC